MTAYMVKKIRLDIVRVPSLPPAAPRISQEGTALSEAFSVYLDVGTMKNFERGEENAEGKSLKEARAGLCAHGDL